MDTIRKVHAPWKELKRDSSIKWETGSENQYTGPQGVSLTGTSQSIVRLSGTAESLA